MNMFSWQGLSFMTSAVGHPVRLHPGTASCSNFKIAKIFVNADLSKDLPTKINFTKNGKSFLVEFSYPWLPMHCHTCKKWGHLEKACVVNKKDGVGIEEQILKNAELNAEKSIGKKKEDAVIDTEAEKQKEDKERTEPENNVRSPTKRVLKYGQVEILTPSRFSVLKDVNENGDLIKQVEEVEEEGEIKVDEETKAMEGLCVVEEGKIREVEEINGGNETRKDKETKEDMEIEELNGNTGNTESVGIEERSNAAEEDMVQNSKKEQARSPTYCDVVRSEAGRETQVKASNLDMVGKLRPSLPRNSKTNHRVVISDNSGAGTGMPGLLEKKVLVSTLNDRFLLEYKGI